MLLTKQPLFRISFTNDPCHPWLTCKFAWQGWQRSAVKHRHNNGQHDCYQIHYFVFFKLLAYTSTGTLRHSASCMDIHTSSHPCTCQQICPTATASQTVKGKGWWSNCSKASNDGHSNLGRVKLSRDRVPHASSWELGVTIGFRWQDGSCSHDH